MRRTCVLFFILGSFYSAIALDPHKSLKEYSRSVWTQLNGLPQDRIRAITQTTDGYLWLGTDEGLTRFDGYDFVVFNRDNANLPSNSVTALAAGSDGSLWIGTPNGLTQYKNRRFFSYTHVQGLTNDSITFLFVDHANTVWIVAAGVLSSFDGKTFTSFPSDHDILVAVAEDRRTNQLYVAGYSSITRLENGRFVPVLRLATSEPGSLALDVKVDHIGNLWLLGRRTLTERFPDGRVKEYRANDIMPKSFSLRAIWEDRDGNLLVGTDGGLARLEDGGFQTLTDIERGDRGSVRCLFEDLEGNLWVGSSTGLTRLRDDMFTVLGTSEGLPSDEPNTVCQDHSGRVWIGFFDSGLMLYSDATRQVPITRFWLPKSRVYSLREDRSGELLVASSEGMIRLKDGQMSAFVAPDAPLGVKRTYDVLEESPGHLLLALPSGLGELRGDKFRMLLPGGPLQDNYFINLAQTTDGSVWAGTYRRGLWHVAGTAMRQYTSADGLGSDAIRSLYADRQGTLWIGTSGGGLNAFRNGRFVTWRARDGLLSDNISNVLDDGESLWLTTTRGICRISKKQLDDFNEHRIKMLTPVNYGVADGLRSAQGPPNFSAGGDRQSDGSLWIATSRGVAIYNPRGASKVEDLVPVLQIEQMEADGHEFDWASKPQVPPGDGRLQIRYTGIHLRGPDRVRYLYKLDGVDSDWVSADMRRVVNYNSLKSGHYQFHTRAQLPTGLLSEKSFEFDLLPHYYETVSFRVLCGLMLVAIGWMAYRFRVRQVRSRYALVLEERARLAREVHDTLTQAFAGLCSQLDAISLCLHHDLEAAGTFVNLARRMAGHSLTEARRSVMDLRATVLDEQSLAQALESGAHDWTAGSGVDVEVNVNGDTRNLPEDVAHHVLRIAQEAVTNALKHARASEIAIQLCVHARQLTLNIADNGCGFQQNDVFISGNGHFGLIGMRERAERLEGQLNLKSVIGGGTQLEISVPLR